MLLSSPLAFIRSPSFVMSYMILVIIMNDGGQTCLNNSNYFCHLEYKYNGISE